MIGGTTLSPLSDFLYSFHNTLSITVVANVNALPTQAISTLCFVLKIGQLLPSFPATNTGIIGFIAHRGLLN